MNFRVSRRPAPERRRALHHGGGPYGLPTNDTFRDRIEDNYRARAHLMGHSDPKSTQCYTELDVEDKRRVMNAAFAGDRDLDDADFWL